MVMSEMKFTLSGFEYFLNKDDKSLFDDIPLPGNCPADLVRAVIMERAGEFETLYADPYQMRFASKVFFLKHQRTFEQWFMGINLDYEPLWNFDRHEEWTENFEGEKNNTESGTNSNTKTLNTHTTNNSATSGTDTNLKTLDTTRTDNLDVDLDDTTTYNETDLLNGQETESGTITNAKDETTSGSASNSTTRVVDQDETSSGSGQNENTVAAFNTSTSQNPYNPNAKDVNSNSGTRAFDETDTTTSSDTNSATLDSDNTETRDLSKGVTNTNTKNGMETIDHSGTEEREIKDTGTITDALTHNTSVNGSSSDTGTISDSGATSGTGNATEENERTHTGHLYGNIGVTTSSALLKEFLDISAWNFFDHVAELYCEELLITVY